MSTLCQGSVSASCHPLSGVLTCQRREKTFYVSRQPWGRVNTLSGLRVSVVSPSAPARQSCVHGSTRKSFLTVMVKISFYVVILKLKNQIFLPTSTPTSHPYLLHTQQEASDCILRFLMLLSIPSRLLSYLENPRSG